MINLIFKEFANSPHAVFNSIAIYKSYATISGYTLGFVLHSAFILATTLWCTLLIIFRIVAVVRAEARLGTYRHVIEVFVESSALYSLSLILYVAVFCYDTPATFYIDVVAGIARVCSSIVTVCLSYSFYAGNRTDAPRGACSGGTCPTG